MLLSPRVGFNWDVHGDRSTQVRGGTGIFTGRRRMCGSRTRSVNTGVLTGFEDAAARPQPSVQSGSEPVQADHVTGTPAATYDLTVTDPDFKFPQVWRTNIAVDQRLPGGSIGTAEFLYSEDVNGLYYINANLPAAQTVFTGADARPR